MIIRKSLFFLSWILPLPFMPDFCTDENRLCTGQERVFTAMEKEDGRLQAVPASSSTVWHPLKYISLRAFSSEKVK